MQYTVPQFIDTEDKIVGPITVRQFLIMIVSAILIAITYAILKFTYFIFAAIFIATLTVILAFVKINGRPFHFFLISFIERTKKPAARVWNKDLTDAELRVFLKKKDEEKPEERTQARRFTSSRLNQLSLIVDTSGEYRGEDILNHPTPQNSNVLPPKKTV